MRTKFTFYLHALILVSVLLLTSIYNASAQTYCTSVYSSSCTGGGRITDVTTSGGSVNISKIGSDCTGAVGSFSDFTATDSLQQMQGVSTTISVKTIGWGCGVKVWIDYNNDGEFGTDELVASSPGVVAAGSTYTSTFTIPYTATAGKTRMRVKGVEGTTSFTPCSSHSWGEVEDYTVRIIEAASCETMDLVAGTLGDVTICPSVPFTIVNSGTSLGLGFNRVWQSRPVGSATWTTIAGAGEVNYSSPGITENTEYRCIVSCPASGEEEITSTATVTLSSFMDCYCIPVYTSSCTGGGRIDDVVTFDGVENISNIGSNCTGAVGSYSDFTSMTFSQVQGVTSSINVKILGWACGVKVWIDYNHNGVFDTDELVTASSGTIAAGSTYSGSFTVPYTALGGPTRMRVKAVEGTTSFTPCSSHSWGEVEDYTVNVIPALPCEELELMAGTLSNITVCPSTPFTLPNSGSSLGIGFSRVWQSRPVGSSTWTTISGASGLSYSSTGITDDTEYRCIVSCPASGEVDTTNVAIVTMNDFMDCYCTPLYTSTCTGGSRINDVITEEAIVNISNTGTGCTGAIGSYSNFTALEVHQIQGDIVEITVGIEGWGSGVKVWIDWNQNGIFETSELVAASSSVISAGTSYTETFTVPPTATVGQTRMRVRAVESATDFSPCSTHSWGEVEDYTFNVLPMPVCSESHVLFPDTISIASTPAALCISGDVTMGIVTSMPVASGLTYQWQIATSASGPFTNVGGLLTSPSYVHTGITSDRWFKLLVYCEGTLLYTSHAYHVMAVNPVAPTLYDGQHCGPGPVELTGTVSTGFIYWYENPTGGTPIGVGNSFLTPPLTSDATFYASAGASPSIDTFVSGGTGYTGSSIASPFFHSWGGYKHQYLILASELLSIGIPAGTALSSIGVHVPAATGTTYNDFSISIGTTTSSTVAGSYFTGLSGVYGPVNYLPTSGVNTFNFSSSLVWDGVSNLVVQMCFSNEDWGGTSTSVTYTNTTFNSHGYYYLDGTSVSTICGSSTMYTTSSRPFFYFNIAGCETDRFPVQAFIRDTPVINIMEEDGVYCLFNNEFNLNSYPEAPAGQTLLWSTGSTAPSITVGPSAPNTKFWVEITNEWGCKNSDTATLTLNPSPEVDLGPDVLICEGGTLTLDGGPDGSSYFWSTGATTREITVEEDGHYIVLVTNSYGCMATDTIYVEVDGYAPELSGIIVDHLTSNTFRFTPHLPMYIDSYEWDFGDGSPVQTVASPVHVYSGPGTYMVTCTVTSSCATRVYTTYANIFTGVDNADLQTMLNVYPNPTHDYINIEVDGSVHMETIRVTNILGQNVLEEIDLRNPKSVKLDVTRLPSGTYHINISTDKGNVIKTFQVVK